MDKIRFLPMPHVSIKVVHFENHAQIFATKGRNTVVLANLNEEGFTLNNDPHDVDMIQNVLGIATTPRVGISVKALPL